MGESSRTKADLWVQVVVVHVEFIVERARVDRPKRDAAAETKKRQQLMAERLETSETASRWLAGDEEPLQK